MVQQFGALHIRSIILSLMVVILEECQRFLKRGALDKHQSDPMMDHPARYGYGLVVLEGLESFGDHFPCSQPDVAGGTLVRWQAVNPQECLWRFGGHALFSELDIV